MTAKEKANELVDKMLNQQSYSEDLYDAKQCALVAVDEILNDCDASSPFEVDRIDFWQQVKTEIEKL
jgi:hypothetical protein